MRKILIFNWKMNPQSETEALKLARAADAASVILAPPFVFLSQVGRILKKALLAAQDLFWEEKGAFTGEISSGQLKSLKVRYVIVGHSERRKIIGEDDEIINKKVLASLKAGLKVVLCVGELSQSADLRGSKRGLTRTRRGFTRNINLAKNYVEKQLQSDLKGIKYHELRVKKNLIIAYEPVWAIGTGRAAVPQDVLEMIKFIKEYLAKFLKIPALKLLVLYGGSVNSKNLAAFLKYPEIDGALVGGASLEAKDFKKMLLIAGINKNV